jgi:hypothetical protein
MFGAFAGRQGHAHFLTQQAARPDESNTVYGQIAAKEREGTAVLGLDQHRMNEVNAALAAPLIPGGRLVALDQLPHGPVKAPLPSLLTATGTGAWGIAITTVTVA